MTSTPTPADTASLGGYRPSRAQDVTGWTGWVVFAGVMLTLLGAFQTIEGLVAVFDRGFYLVGAEGLIVHVDYTVWGWVHLILGVLAVAAGIGLTKGNMAARMLGVILAVLSAILNLAFLAAYPIWSTIVIAVDIIVIYAIVVHGRELQTRPGDDFDGRSTRRALCGPGKPAAPACAVVERSRPGRRAGTRRRRVRRGDERTTVYPPIHRTWATVAERADDSTWPGLRAAQVTTNPESPTSSTVRPLRKVWGSGLVSAYTRCRGPRWDWSRGPRATTRVGPGRRIRPGGAENIWRIARLRRRARMLI